MKAVTSNPVGQEPMSVELANGGFGGGSYNAAWFADSRPDGTPLSNLSQRASVLQCDRLNAVLGGTDPYQLITNAQWQTMASAIESVSENWSLAVVGSGQIARGNSDNASDAQASLNGLRGSVPPLAAMSTPGLYSSGTIYNWSFESPSEEFLEGYRGTGNHALQAYGSGGEQRRTHYMPTGDVIWDVAGNSYEWVRFTGEEGNLDLGLAANTEDTFNSRLLPQQPSVGGMKELNDDTIFSNTGGTGALLSIWFRSLRAYSSDLSSFGLGKINIQASATGNVIHRGGRYAYGGEQGIFAAGLEQPPNAVGGHGSHGFRCVYQP